jgi:hypothetical protein
MEGWFWALPAQEPPPCERASGLDRLGRAPRRLHDNGVDKRPSRPYRCVSQKCQKLTSGLLFIGGTPARSGRKGVLGIFEKLGERLGLSAEEHRKIARDGILGNAVGRRHEDAAQRLWDRHLHGGPYTPRDARPLNRMELRLKTCD